MSGDSSRRDFPVLHSPLSLLHNPPHEILSGELQPYFESPDRYHRILDALFPSQHSARPVEESGCAAESEIKDVELDWKEGEVGEPWVLAAIAAVHSQDYLSFLEGVYKEWTAEGGSKAAVLPETFLHRDLVLETSSTPMRPSGAIQKAGKHLAQGVDHSLTSASPGLFSFDLSAPVTAGTWIAALASARLALEAAALLFRDPLLPGVFALCRPPGHHSTPSLCGGYCYLSNAAIATRYLQSLHLPALRIAILDIDYHHGNGTSKVFYADKSVLYVSLHGSPDYPYFTGAESERGAGEGVGANVNFPLPLGTNDSTYLKTLRTATSKIEEWNPAYLVVSLGVDTFVDDSLTDFQLTLAAYPEMGKLIASLEVQTLFVMEGGYCLPKLGTCVRGVLEGYISTWRKDQL